MGWALAHKGKVSEVTYNPDDPPSAYSNPAVHARIKITQRREGRSMGPTGIRVPMTLTESSS